jgi:SNF2 family DNA or RNA helicase
MNYGNECYIMYDKFAGGSHSFKNTLTAKFKLKELFETKTNDASTVYTVDKNAILKYNQKFGNSNFVLPMDIDHKMITVHMFEFKNESGCEITITAIGVYIDKLTNYYNRYNTIPNKDLLISACKFHINYETTIEIKIDNNNVVDTITKKVIVPNSDTMDPIIKHPEFIKNGQRLYDYQRRTVRFMYDTEINKKKIYYGTNFRHEITIGPLVFDIIKQTLLMKDKRDYLQFNGGALIDEVGLGKTIQTLTLCLLNPAPVNELSYIDEEHNMLKSRGTIVLCPNQLCGQWSREIEKMITQKDLKIVLMTTKSHFDKYTYLDMLDADFVIISYNFIGNYCFASKYTSGISPSKSYHRSSAWNQKAVENAFKTKSAELVSDASCLFKTEPLFPLIYWHRIVIDEFHEPYTVSKYSYVKNIIPLLKGTYKWIVTGTPFDKGTSCFFKMFDFVTNYKNDIGENIINIPEIKDHMTNSFFRRNTKKSMEDECKLPELKEKIVWLRFTHTERMMYNAYLTDPNMNKFSVIIRQLCCHPKIADEIKGVLSNCKTLGDIEKSMVSHYKKQYEREVKRVKKCENVVAKTERRILVAEYKRQRKYLKQKGYHVRIEIPKFVLPNFIEDTVEDDVPLTFSNGNTNGYDNGYENEDAYGYNNANKNLQNGINNDDDDIKDDNNDGLNIDNLSDDDDNDDDDKKLIIVNHENQTIIMNLIKKQLNANPSITIQNYKDILKQQKDRLVTANKICDGKKASYNFFVNMLERIKKFTEKSKAKYERLIAKNKLKDSKQNNEEIVSEEEEEDDDDEDKCGICLFPISGEDVGVTKCGHLFCFECLKTSVNSNHKCPMCQLPQTNKDISMISFEKPVFTLKNTDILKNKLELIDKVGTKLTNLIYYLNSIPDHVIIFSQWDSLLRKVGDVLSDHGIRNVFCRGNVWSRDKAIREFSTNDKIKVIMLSSESAASGTNLTKATKVILLDPVSGDYEYRRNMEWQAIGRAYRLGQNKSVEIVRFIIKDTVEEEIHKDNKLEDVKQKTQLNISEVTDETITLSDDKLHSIAEAVKIAKDIRDQKEKAKKEKKEFLSKKVDNSQKIEMVGKQENKIKAKEPSDKPMKLVKRVAVPMK